MEYDYDKDGPLMSRRCLFTNADRIRAMSDEELAAWLCDVAGWLPAFEGRVHPILEWLQQEAPHDQP